MGTDSLPAVTISIPCAAKLCKFGLRECNKSRNSLQPIHFIRDCRTKDHVRRLRAPQGMAP